MSANAPADRREFQLERIILFSDAVFAIAITLLVIEIKVPALHGAEATEGALGHALVQLIPKLIGFLISFALVGLYWTRHHYLFGFVRDYSPRLLALNLLFLLSVVLMPFSTGIFGEYSTPSTMHLQGPLIIYVLNVCLTGLTLYLLWRHVGNPANGLADASLEAGVVRAAKQRAMLISLVFAMVIPVSFVNPYLARYVPIVLPIAIRLTRPRTTR